MGIIEQAEYSKIRMKCESVKRKMFDFSQITLRLNFFHLQKSHKHVIEHKNL